ncbi:MAG: urea transporter [Planctomycetaceae bacterium]
MTTWLVLYVAHHSGLPAVVPVAPVENEPFDMTSAVIKGISEVMFQANVLTGALFLIGIMLSSWKGAFWAIIGSLVGVMVGVSHDAPAENLSLGLYGYNAALAAMALALYRPSVMLPLMAAVVSIPFTEKFPLLGLPTLTAPFVLASWTIIALDTWDARWYDRPKRAEG